MHNQFLQIVDQLPNFGSYSPITFSTQSFLPPPQLTKELFILQVVAEDINENDLTSIDIPQEEVNNVNQLVQEIFQVIRQYLKQPFICFQIQNQQSQITSENIQNQTILTRLKENSILQNYLNKFLNDTFNNNTMMSQLIVKIFQIRNQEFRSELVYIIIHIFYQFCFYHKKNLSDKELVDKAIFSGKNLVQFILESNKIRFVIPYSEHFQTISERDNIFQLFILQLTLNLWRYSSSKNNKNLNHVFNQQLQDLQNKHQRIQLNNVSKSASLDDFLVSRAQSQCIYDSSEQEQQINFCNNRRSRMDILDHRSIQIHNSFTINNPKFQSDRQLSLIDLKISEETVEPQKKLQLKRNKNELVVQFSSMSFSEKSN